MPLWPSITMATQHPDNAGKPWWNEGAFVSTPDEITELITLFQETPIEEYMWDWEGKFVDEAVGEKLFSRAQEFFREKVLGRDLFLTYRIPAWEQGKTHRMARSFMNILSLADLAHEIKLPAPPVTEMFLPLTTSADQVLAVRRTFRETAEYHRLVFHGSQADERLLLSLVRVTPLVEDVDSLFSIEKILEPYWGTLVAEDGEAVRRGQRIFLARSDPAMNAGLLPAVLAVRSALSTAYSLGEKFGFPVYPVIGTGSLPFRGGVFPGNEKNFLPQYAGTRTYSIQSAFRYDYEKAEVLQSLDVMHREVPNHGVMLMTQEEKLQLQTISKYITSLWQPAIEHMAVAINTIAKYIPARRERMQHIGLFGYSRGVGKVTLPRAIGFTCALYSLGVPPELIATGRGLLQAEKDGVLPLIKKHYPSLVSDLTLAGQFYNAENLALLAKESSVWAGVQEDVMGIERVLGITLGPVTPDHLLHRNLTSSVLLRMKGEPDAEAFTRDIVQAGVLRKSLG